MNSASSSVVKAEKPGFEVVLRVKAATHEDARRIVDAALAASASPTKEKTK